jgi:hypothetical protein
MLRPPVAARSLPAAVPVRRHAPDLALVCGRSRERVLLAVAVLTPLTINGWRNWRATSAERQQIAGAIGTGGGIAVDAADRLSHTSGGEAALR